MTWLRLDDATALIDHDVEKARERLKRAISKAWRVRPGGLPQMLDDPNVPLRIQVTPAPGLRVEGRAWLENPTIEVFGSPSIGRSRMTRPLHTRRCFTTTIQLGVLQSSGY